MVLILDTSAAIAILLEKGDFKKYKNNIHNFRKPVPFEWIPKAILYLAALELVLRKKAEYPTSFSKIKNQFDDEESHIVHDSIKIRLVSYNISIEEQNHFIEKAIIYMNEVESLFVRK